MKNVKKFLNEILSMIKSFIQKKYFTNISVDKRIRNTKTRNIIHFFKNCKKIRKNIFFFENMKKKAFFWYSNFTYI